MWKDNLICVMMDYCIMKHGQELNLISGNASVELQMVVSFRGVHIQYSASPKY